MARHAQFPALARRLPMPVLLGISGRLRLQTDQEEEPTNAPRTFQAQTGTEIDVNGRYDTCLQGNQLSKPPVREEGQIAARQLEQFVPECPTLVLRRVFASEVHKHIGKPWGRLVGHVRTLTDGNWRCRGIYPWVDRLVVNEIPPRMTEKRRWEAGEEEDEPWAWREENAAADWETTDEYEATDREPPSPSISLPLAVANQSMGLSSPISALPLPPSSLPLALSTRHWIYVACSCEGPASTTQLLIEPSSPWSSYTSSPDVVSDVRPHPLELR
ncbi:hypothetical protein C8F01DRAFT_1290309 [Mycena amicta]|nr:hypothetical protein C8F01DRAFT_1290309 [Mycena amicta]